MIFDVSHRTTYQYRLPVSQSNHLLHLSPRPVEHQEVLAHSVLVQPAPAARAVASDYFGNPITYLTIDESHRELSFHARSRIKVSARAPMDLATSPPWEDVADAMVRAHSAPLDVIQFASFTPATQANGAILDYASQSFPARRPVMQGVRDLTRRIHKDFVYDGTATDVTTTVERLFQLKRGVCQDFSHLQLACLRALGLPARYVSGYLLTRPPEGKDKLIGADASHAWISVWAPGTGWIDFDATNDLIPAGEHITLAYGRDYGDVSPINGIILGGGHHTITVSVDVRSE